MVIERLFLHNSMDYLNRLIANLFLSVNQQPIRDRPLSAATQALLDRG